jgi:hypothetical protein
MEEYPNENSESPKCFKMENSTIAHLRMEIPDKLSLITLEPLQKPLAPVDSAGQESEPNYFWTTTCCNTKRGFIFNFIALMILSSHMGLIGGFANSMILIYLEKGMPVSHRAVMNLLAIPFLVIYLFVKTQILPIYGTLIDTRHIKSFGKSKTYVLFMPLVYVPAIFLLSFMMVDLLDEVNPWPFFGIMMIVNLFVGTYWVSVDCWIPTIFPDNLKARGSYGRWFGLGKLFF